MHVHPIFLSAARSFELNPSAIMSRLACPKGVERRWTGVRVMYSDSLTCSVAVERLKAELEILKAEPRLSRRPQRLEAMAAQRAVKPWWRRLLRSAR
jgi:hypothetical protein